MRHELKILLASMLTAVSAFRAFGYTPSDSVKVYFRVGYSRFDPSYEDNRRAMDDFICLIREKKEADEIDSIIVRSQTSPEGASVSNEELSRQRCRSIADLLISEGGIDPNKIRQVPEGVAWSELRRIVAATPEAPSREKILHILDNVPLWIRNSKGEITDGRKKRLMDLDRGEAFRWLSANIFPRLRNAVAVTILTAPKQPQPSERSDFSEIPEISGTSEIPDTTEISEISEIPEIPEISESSDTLPAYREPRHFNMAVRSNMLYDALLVPNIGVEFAIGRHVSVYGEWMYAWWDNDRRHRYWRVYGGDLGARWWFGGKQRATSLTGHHLGVYGGILTFDFETGDKGYLGGKPGGTLWDRWIVNTGVEYGYSLPIGSRLSIDFSIGIGYMGGNYIKYYPFDNDYYFDKEYNMHYFGPTKAEVSLVWLIGRGHSNRRKGGEE